MLISKLLSLITRSGNTSESLVDNKAGQTSAVVDGDRNTQSSKNREEDEKITVERLNELVSQMEVGFDEGRYSVKNSRYENEKDAIKAFRNLMYDLNDEEKVMKIMYRYGIKKSTEDRDSDFRNPDIVDYDRDEAVRHN